MCVPNLPQVTTFLPFSGTHGLRGTPMAAARLYRTQAHPSSSLSAFLDPAPVFHITVTAPCGSITAFISLFFISKNLGVSYGMRT